MEPIAIDSVRIDSRGIVVVGANSNRLRRAICRSLEVPYFVVFGALSVKSTRRRRQKARAR